MSSTRESKKDETIGQLAQQQTLTPVSGSAKDQNDDNSNQNNHKQRRSKQRNKVYNLLEAIKAMI